MSQATTQQASQQAPPQPQGQRSVGETAEEATRQLIRRLEDINFLYILIVVALAVLIIWVIRRVVPWLARYAPNAYRINILGIVPVARLVVLVIMIALIVNEVVNLDRQNILVIGGALGVALGFGFKDLVGSVIAGVVAVFEKPYRPGDWVRVGDSYGEITNVGLRAFQMVTPNDDVVTVTHDRIWGENVANSNDGAQTLMCVANFYVHPDHDAETLRRLLQEVALTSPYLSYAKPVLVMLKEEPWGTHYMLKAYPFDMGDQFRFISDMTVRGKKVMHGMGAREVTAPAVAPTPS